MRASLLALSVVLCASCGSAPRPVLAPLQSPTNTTSASCEDANAALSEIAKLTRVSGKNAIDLLGSNATLSIPEASLDHNETYTLIARLSTSVVGGSKVVVQAAGTPIDPLDPNTEALTTFTTSGCGETFEVPVGNWTLRPDLALSITAGSADAALDLAQLVPAGNRPTLGVNATDIAWDPNASATMSRIVEAGAHEIRMNIRGTELLDTTLQLMAQANQGGAKVLVIISGDISDWDSTYPSPIDSAQFQSVCGYAESNIQPISQVDVSRYSARVTAYVQALAANHIQVAGFELGNEWDWSCFNTDFPMSGDPDPQTLQAFLAKYAALVQATQTIVDAAYAGSPGPPIGVFGMANANAAVSVDILQGLTSVDGHNVLDSVDFVGQHLYKSLDDDKKILEQSWELSGKPTWVTEWGVSADTGWARYSAMEDFMGMLADEVEHEPQVAMVFDWYSIFYNSSTSQVVMPEAGIFNAFP